MDPLDKKFEEWLEEKDLGTDASKILSEGMQTSRYSVEVNYRTTMSELMDGFAKITLGYVSAAMKNCGYHCKTLFTENPQRVIVSTRHWDDGEWVGIVCFHEKDGCFAVGKGNFNKDRKTVSVKEMKKCDAKSAAEVVKDIRNLMETLKKEKPKTEIELNSPRAKTGPKSTKVKKIKSTFTPWKPKKPAF